MQQIARTPKQIGEAIRRRREQAGHSQLELGRMAGLRQATISQIENGNQATRVETLCLTLSALGLEFVITDRSQGSQGDLGDWFDAP